jgi:RecG-like helicase
MRKYFNGLLFSLVEGQALSDFMNSAYKISCKETVTGNYDIGIITSLPATYVRSVERAESERKITFARGGFLGEVGDKVEVEIEILKQNWSQKYMTWYITGITDNDNVVFFAYKQDMKVGSRVTITGSVKSHRDNDSTQLARVKVVNNV